MSAQLKRPFPPSTIPSFRDQSKSGPIDSRLSKKSSYFVGSFCSTASSSLLSLAVSDSDGPFDAEFEEEEEGVAVVVEFDGADDDEDDEVEEEEAEAEDDDDEGGAEEEEEGPVEGPFSLSSDFNCASHVCRPLSVGNSLLTTTMTLSELLVIISMTC